MMMRVSQIVFLNKTHFTLNGGNYTCFLTSDVDSVVLDMYNPVNNLWLSLPSQLDGLAGNGVYSISVQIIGMALRLVFTSYDYIYLPNGRWVEGNSFALDDTTRLGVT